MFTQLQIPVHELRTVMCGDRAIFQQLISGIVDNANWQRLAYLVSSGIQVLSWLSLVITIFFKRFS